MFIRCSDCGGYSKPHSFTNKYWIKGEIGMYLNEIEQKLNQNVKLTVMLKEVNSATTKNGSPYLTL